MPDWTYHPFFKPWLFLIPPETARRLTIGALSFQSKTTVGRWLFRKFSADPPPPTAVCHVFGLTFPSCVGLSPGIDTHGDALLFLKDHFGFGFLELGPVDRTARPYHPDFCPRRDIAAFTLSRSMLAGSPSSQELAEKIGNAGGRKMPVGLALTENDPIESLLASEKNVDFFTLPESLLLNTELVKSLRDLTKKPLIIRLRPVSSLDELDKTLSLSMEIGMNGCLVVEGKPSQALPEGLIEGPFLKEQALALVRHIHRRCGAQFPVIGSGGIMTPADALDFLDAGATLVEIYSGFVFAGPGLPLRIVNAVAEHLDRRVPLPSAAPHQPDAKGKPKLRTQNMFATNWGWRLLAFSGLVLMFSGLLAFFIAMTVKLLPPDVHFLGMNAQQICDKNGCRILHFMAHDRVSFGGSLVSIGCIYFWLARIPLRRGESWAWWALTLSGFFGFLSFLTYLGTGYFDLWHGVATSLLLPFFVAGLCLAWPTLKTPRSIRSCPSVITPAWIWSPANLGRLAISFAIFGMLSGGLVIMLVGMTAVFVPQDLAYMGITIEELGQINTKLIPLIAHDRAGFGGGLFSGGIAIAFALWCGARPGEKSLWWALLFSGLVGFGTAIGVHPIIGYTSFIHLLPAYLGAAAFFCGIFWLRRPLCLEKIGAQRFSDV